jgi:hypothetical protein
MIELNKKAFSHLETVLSREWLEPNGLAIDQLPKNGIHLV